MALRWPLHLHESIPTNSRASLGASLTPDGLMYLGIPGVMHDRPEIGFYRHALGPERVREFAELIEQLGVWEIASVAPRWPDPRAVTMSQGEGDDRLNKVWTLDALPPEVVTVFDAFNRLVLEAYASPVRVVSGAGRWLAPSFSAREPLRLEFTLRSKGTETVALQDPMAPQPLDSLLQIMVGRVPDSKGRAPHPTSASITPASLTRPDLPPFGRNAQPAPYLALAPGEEARFGVTCSLYLSPGEYQAVLLLNTGGGPNTPPNHESGILAIELPRIHVVHR
jgi:hypothetical protein